MRAADERQVGHSERANAITAQDSELKRHQILRKLMLEGKRLDSFLKICEDWADALLEVGADIKFTHNGEIRTTYCYAPDSPFSQTSYRFNLSCEELVGALERNHSVSRKNQLQVPHLKTWAADPPSYNSMSAYCLLREKPGKFSGVVTVRLDADTVTFKSASREVVLRHSLVHDAKVQVHVKSEFLNRLFADCGLKLDRFGVSVESGVPRISVEFAKGSERLVRSVAAIPVY